MKFYPTNERILVAGGGAGGSYIAKGGNGGGLTGTKPFYLGSTADPNYSGFRFPNGGNQGAGGGAGFGASAPSHGAIYPNTSIETAGRAGAGGGWFGGYAEQSDYNTSTVIGRGLWALPFYGDKWNYLWIWRSWKRYVSMEYTATCRQEWNCSF